MSSGFRARSEELEEFLAAMEFPDVRRMQELAPKLKKAELKLAFKESVNCGHTEAVEVLLDAGVNPNGFSDEKDTYLTFAAKNNLYDMAILLLEYGANPNKAPDGRTALDFAIEANNLELVKELIEAGADRNRSVDGGPTPLELARYHEYADIEEYLLSIGAQSQDPTLARNSPAPAVSPDSIAPLRGRLRFAEGGALETIHKIDKENMGKKDPSWVKIGAAMKTKDYVERDPERAMKTNLLLKATAEGDLRTVRRLIEEEGLSANSADEFMRTPIMTALRHVQKDVALYLLDKGADTFVVDQHGRGIRDIATEAAFKIQRLVQKGKAPEESAAAFNEIGEAIYEADKRRYEEHQLEIRRAREEAREKAREARRREEEVRRAEAARAAAAYEREADHSDEEEVVLPLAFEGIESPFANKIGTKRERSEVSNLSESDKAQARAIAASVSSPASKEPTAKRKSGKDRAAGARSK